MNDDDERIGVRDVRDSRISDMGPSNGPSLCPEAYHSVGPEPRLLLFRPLPSPTREGTPIRASDQSRIFFQLKKGLPSDSFPMPWTREECGLPPLQRLVAVGGEENCHGSPSCSLTWGLGACGLVGHVSAVMERVMVTT